MCVTLGASPGTTRSGQEEKSDTGTEQAAAVKQDTANVHMYADRLSAWHLLVQILHSILKRQQMIAVDISLVGKGCQDFLQYPCCSICKVLQDVCPGCMPLKHVVQLFIKALHMTNDPAVIWTTQLTMMFALQSHASLLELGSKLHVFADIKDRPTTSHKASSPSFRLTDQVTCHNMLFLHSREA